MVAIGAPANRASSAALKRNISPARHFNLVVFGSPAPVRRSHWRDRFDRTPNGDRIMAFVDCEPCRDCKYTDCVVVCPCDCFYQDDTMLYIHPVDCIDCEACVPECPVEAIFHDENV